MSYVGPTKRHINPLVKLHRVETESETEPFSFCLCFSFLLAHDQQMSPTVRLTHESAQPGNQKHMQLIICSLIHSSQISPKIPVRRKPETGNFFECGMQRQPQTWQCPLLRPPPNSCCLSPHHHRVTALFQVICYLWDGDRLAPHLSTEQISEATHLLPLALAARLGTVRGTDVEEYRCVFICVCLLNKCYRGCCITLHLQEWT